MLGRLTNSLKGPLIQLCGQPLRAALKNWHSLKPGLRIAQCLIFQFTFRTLLFLAHIPNFNALLMRQFPSLRISSTNGAFNGTAKAIQTIGEVDVERKKVSVLSYLTAL